MKKKLCKKMKKVWLKLLEAELAHKKKKVKKLEAKMIALELELKSDRC
jgi:hypothetical protein